MTTRATSDGAARAADRRPDARAGTGGRAPGRPAVHRGASVLAALAVPALALAASCGEAPPPRAEAPPRASRPAPSAGPGSTATARPDPASRRRASSWTAWETTPDGLAVRRYLGTGDGRIDSLVLIRLDPTRHVLAVMAAERDDDGLRASDAANVGAIAAVNGGFFDAAGRPLGWVVAFGRELSAPASSGWGLLRIDDGSPSIRPADSPGEGIPDAALQAGPRLVVDGRPVDVKSARARRTAVGVDADGRPVLVSSGLGAADMQALADLLAAPPSEGGAGLVAALALDGGASSQLWLRRPAPGEPELSVPGVPVPNLLAVLPRD